MAGPHSPALEGTGHPVCVGADVADRQLRGPVPDAAAPPGGRAQCSRGTRTGALVVGLLEAFASFWASAYKEVIVFTLIIPVLLWRSLTSRHVEEEE